MTIPEFIALLRAAMAKVDRPPDREEERRYAFDAAWESLDEALAWMERAANVPEVRRAA